MQQWPKAARSSRRSVGMANAFIWRHALSLSKMGDAVGNASAGLMYRPDGDGIHA